MLLPFILILLQSICVGVISLIRKKYQEFNGAGLLPTIIFTIFYYLFEIVVSLLVSCCFMQIGFLANVTPLTIMIAAIFAFASLVSTIICIIGPAYGSLPILMMFASLGSLTMSSTYDIILGQASITNRYIAALVFIGIILFINVYSNKSESSKDKKGSLIYKLLCVALFFTNGFGLIFYHIFVINNPTFGNFNFIALFSVFGVLIGLLTFVCLCIFRKEKRAFSHIKEVRGRGYFLILLYALFICASEALTLNATSIIPLSIQAPLSFALAIISVTILDCLFYKTRIKTPQLIQMGAAILSAILISSN